MNKNDYKALLISIIAGLVSGLAVNITWSHLGSVSDPLPAYSMRGYCSGFQGLLQCFQGIGQATIFPWVTGAWLEALAVP